MELYPCVLSRRCPQASRRTSERGMRVMGAGARVTTFFKPHLSCRIHDVVVITYIHQTGRVAIKAGRIYLTRGGHIAAGLTHRPA
jgi:hypothetical protein